VVLSCYAMLRGYLALTEGKNGERKRGGPLVGRWCGVVGWLVWVRFGGIFVREVV